MREMPEVLIFGIVGFTVDLQGNIVRFGVINFFIAGLDIPFTPRRNDCHIRRKCLDRQLKTHLVVSLTRTAVTDCIGTLRLCNFYQALCNAGAGMRSAKKIIFVFGVGFQTGPNIVFNIILLQIFNIQFRRARFQRLFFQAVKLRTLSNVARYCNDFAVIVIFLQPWNNDGRIQSAGIGENYFFNLIFLHIKTSEQSVFIHL